MRVYRLLSRVHLPPATDCTRLYHRIHRKLGSSPCAFTRSCATHHPQRSPTTCPPPSLYAQLEARLVQSPITPTESLELLACDAPAVHHRGVLQHLVHTIHGNACCLIPSACRSLMAGLLSPSPPSTLRDEVGEEEEERSGLRCTHADLALTDAAVRVALAPLLTTLLRCVVTDLQLQLHFTTLRATEQNMQAPPPLWWWCASSCSPSSCFNGLVERDDGTAREAHTPPPPPPAALLESAAVLLAFTMEHTAARRSSRSAPAHLLGDASRCAAPCTRVVLAVVRHLHTEQTAKDVAPQPMALHTDRSAAESACVNEDEQSWRRFAATARRCWHWSTVVCRAMPVFPSRKLRTFAVAALIEALAALHQCVSRLHQVDLPAGRRSVVVEVLCWLLTRSLPMVRGAAPVSGVSARLPWTARLRSSLAALADDVSAFTVDVLQDAEARSAHLTRITAVAFRLALQSAAAAEGVTASAATMGSETAVVGRLLAQVLACDVRLTSPIPTLGDGSGGEGRQGTSPVWVTEETWCRLASLQHFALRTAMSGDDTTASVATQQDEDVSYARLLRIGVDYLTRCAAATTAASPCNYTDGVGRTNPVDTFANTSLSNDPESRPSTGVSMKFVFSFVKCWRAWLETCPVDNAGATWLCGTRGIVSEATYREHKGALRQRGGVASAAAVLWSSESHTSLHQLSLWLVEAWAEALSADTEVTILDVCACWSSLSGTTRDPPPRLSDMARALAACEHRLCHQCGEWVYNDRNRFFRVSASALMTLPDVRPRLSYPGAALHPMLPTEVAGSRHMWRPSALPAVVSQLSLRVLTPAVTALPLHPWGCAIGSNCGGDVDASSRQLPVSDAVVDVVRRCVAAPPAMELAHFSLYVVSTFVEWCATAGMHEGWCWLTVADCDTGSEDGSAPWLLLAVAGLVSSSGLPGAPDAAAHVLLWSWQGGGGGGGGGAVGLLECVPSGVTTFVAPSAATAAPQPLPSFLGDVANPSTWFRREVCRWTRRYAVRLLLFSFADDEWQRYRGAGARCPSSPPAVLSRWDARSPCPWNWSAPASAAQWRGRSAGMFSVSDFGAAAAPSRLARAITVSAHDGSPSVWQSDALQVLLERAAHLLIRRVEQLTHAVRSSPLLSRPDPTCTREEEELHRAIAALMGQLSEQPHTSPIGTGATAASCPRDACVEGLLGLLRDDIDPAVAAERQGRPRVDLTAWLRSQHPACPLSLRVRELEAQLSDLRLIPPVETAWQEEVGEHAGCVRDVAGEEEARALLAVLCRSPEASFLTSPRVLRLVEALWCTCWGSLLRHLTDVARAEDASTVIAPEKWWERVAVTTGAAAELDALVTCRLLLRATHHLHSLAAEVVDYLSTAYVPALKAAAMTALSSSSSCGFVTTPMEALEAQLAERDATAVDSSDTQNTSGGFRFSPSSLRTYEVLCCGRFGREEHRSPCVWQRWMQEIAREDVMLQQGLLRAQNL